MLPVPEVSTSAAFYVFSKRDDSIWKDARVRRALSMCVDRDLLIHSLNNLDEFEKEGLKVPTYWNSHLAAGQPEWLDPKGTGLGEGAKFFKFDPAEAKKLLTAAGLQTPVKSTMGDYTDMTPERFQGTLTLAQEITQSGVFNMEAEPLLYNTTWRVARQSGGMGFSGMLHHSGNTNPTQQQLLAFFTPNGSNTSSAVPIPNVTDKVYRVRGIADPAARTALVEEIQRDLAMEWPMMTEPGDAPGFTLQWPWLRNSNIFKAINPNTARLFTRHWYDKAMHERLTKGG
jgi:ABC-type transport system substrate-binding protein